MSGGVDGPVVVAGAAVAGVTLALALRELGHEGVIVLLDAADGVPHQRPPLSKEVLAGADPGCADLVRPGELESLGIELHTGVRALGLDVVARRLQTSAGPRAYGELVIATGARPVVPAPLRAAVARGAHVLRTREDATSLAAALGAADSLTVIGGGVLGSEIAAASVRRGLRTTVVSRSALAVGPVRGVLASPLVGLHRHHGVQVHAPRPLARVAGGPGAWRVELEGVQGAEPVVPASGVLVVAAGAAPDVAWLGPSVPVGARGLRCDAVGRVVPGVWAVGDAADGPTDSVARMTQAGAIAQARTSAGAMLGVDAPVAQPYFWSDLHGVRVQAVGELPDDGSLAVLEPDDDGGPRTAVVGRDGVVVGAVAWGSPRGFRHARGLLGSPLAEVGTAA